MMSAGFSSLHLVHLSISMPSKIFANDCLGLLRPLGTSLPFHPSWHRSSSSVAHPPAAAASTQVSLGWPCCKTPGPWHLSRPSGSYLQNAAMLGS